MRDQVNIFMSRYFCMLDTRDVLDDRLVINTHTDVNIPQAVAESINPELNHTERVKHAKKASSEYMNKVWVSYQNKHAVVDIQAGSVDQPHDIPDVRQVKEYQFREMCTQFKSCEYIYKHGTIYYCLNRYRIVNTDAREEYYNRSSINVNINVINMMIDGICFISTISRGCVLDVQLAVDWTGMQGALIEQSDDNKRDHLKHVV